MSTPARVTAFVLGLAAVFGVALAIGNRIGPVGQDAAAHEAGHGTGHEADHEAGHEVAGAETVPAGLSVSRDGYTLRLDHTTAAPGAKVELAFTIEGPDGEPVTAYDLKHEKRLHLIVVRRDFTGFQHVHPTLAGDGTWRTTVDLTPGAWRVFADFAPTGGRPQVLGADLGVPGDYSPAPTADRDVRTATADGLTVRLEGDLDAGRDSRLTLKVTRDGKPVTDLQPYLGAYGHLVTLRSGDLAYLHVHPDVEADDPAAKAGPDVVFHTSAPSADRYHLYFDFQHDGVVRTAAFTLEAAGMPEAKDTTEGGSDDDGHGSGEHQH